MRVAFDCAMGRKVLAEAGSSGVPDEGLSLVQRKQWYGLLTSASELWHLVRAQAVPASGLTYSEWRLLEVLSLAPRLRISDLSELSRIGMSTVSRQITKLIAAGRAEVVNNGPGDARQKWVTITAAGREALAPVVAARDRVIREAVLDVLSEDEFAQLVDMFQRVGERAAQLAE